MDFPWCPFTIPALPQILQCSQGDSSLIHRGVIVQRLSYAYIPRALGDASAGDFSRPIFPNHTTSYRRRDFMSHKSYIDRRQFLRLMGMTAMAASTLPTNIAKALQIP